MEQLNNQQNENLSLEKNEVSSMEQQVSQPVQEEPMKTEPVVEQPKEEVKEEKKQEVKYDDNHSAESPYYNELSKEEFKEKNGDTVFENAFIIPTSTYKLLNEFIEVINKQEETDYTEDERVAAQLSAVSTRLTVRNNVFVDKLNDAIGKFINRVKFGKHNMNLRNLTFDNREGELTGSQAALRFRSLLSVGNPVQIPLWHSGIWVTIKPPTQTDIINLQVALASSEIELGRDTNTLVYSNYSVVFTRIITEFIMRHLDMHTLKIDDGSDLREHISLHDYYPLVLGMLSCMYPKGLHVVKACSNNLKIDANKKPMCSFVGTADLDPNKLLWVDRTALSQRMLSHMANRLERSMSVDAVDEYKSGLTPTQDKEYTLQTDNGSEFKITFGIPNLKDYITNGERWVNNIIKKAESIFTDTDGVTEKNQKVDDLTMASVLGIYNMYVKQITMNETSVVKDLDSITEILSIMSTDDKAFEGFLKSIEEYITSSSVAIVATPNYICPECGKDQNEGASGPFKELIPLNIVEHFFALCALRAERTRNRVTQMEK